MPTLHATALESKKAQFQLPENITYLNCAYMGPLTREVEQAGIRGLTMKRVPTRFTHQEFFEDADEVRKLYLPIINASDPQRVVIIPSVSYGMAIVARNTPIKAGQEILTLHEQFPSNMYAWKELANEKGATVRVVDAPKGTANRGARWNESILEAITEKTALVALGHIHWADGTLINLEAIREKTWKVGAKLVIDGTQSVGALPFDVQKIQPDALVCAAYKWLMGPYAIGLAYLGEAYDNGKPLEENWINRLHSEDFTNLVNYQDEYQPKALRYEMGERSNFIGLPMLIQALKHINEWQVDRIQDYCYRISQSAVQQLQNEGFWIEEDNFRAKHLFGIRLPDAKDMNQVKKALERENIKVSVRGNAIRVSPHLYNDEADMLKLANCLVSA
jgi:selenocysteine lyase/cysteine desulfurase